MDIYIYYRDFRVGMFTSQHGCGFHTEFTATDDPDGFHDVVSELVPMKRYGTDAEVASLALFLASDESSYTTGSVFMVDGGFTAA